MPEVTILSHIQCSHAHAQMSRNISAGKKKRPRGYCDRFCLIGAKNCDFGKEIYENAAKLTRTYVIIPATLQFLNQEHHWNCSLILLIVLKLLLESSIGKLLLKAGGV